MPEKSAPVELSNSEQFKLRNARGEEYLIQISWPLHWQDDGTLGCGKLPVMYIVDGNSLFLTATEAAWRRATSDHFSGGGLIVAIGYPIIGKVYDVDRRNFDLTPPTDNYIPRQGGADLFLDFIDTIVRPAVKSRFPQLSIEREALYGHSYGGLFALHALFTYPQSFNCYIASSPSIWWNSRHILHEAKAFLDQVQTEKSLKNKSTLPILLIYIGAWEQKPPQWNSEPLEDYEDRKKTAQALRMVDNAIDLYDMTKDCDELRTVSLRIYDGEEHTSVMACSMSRSLTEFFEDWPLNRGQREELNGSTEQVN